MLSTLFDWASTLLVVLLIGCFVGVFAVIIHGLLQEDDDG